MTRYLFKRVESSRDILEAIGRKDIPENKVIIKRPAIDEKTGEPIADIEIEFPDDVQLSPFEEEKLISLLRGQGHVLKAKIASNTSSDSQ